MQLKNIAAVPGGTNEFQPIIFNEQRSTYLWLKLLLPASRNFVR